MAVFPYFSTFFQRNTPQKVLTAYRVPIYQIKAHEMLFKVQKKLICFDKKLVRRNTLTLKISLNVWGNFEGILGNPGEIPRAGYRVRGV